jgi:predicted AAA+ superfamily ATPase
VQTYLREEVQQEGLTRNLGAFARFLEAAIFSQGSVLNITAVARECHVERKVVEDYFTILEDLLLAVRVPVFSRKAKRRPMTHRKYAGTTRRGTGRRDSTVDAAKRTA